jgi:mannose-6-phosphate isomerase class I
MTAMISPVLWPKGRSKDTTIQQLLEQSPIQLLGNLAGCFRRFPLLLKFLDARGCCQCGYIHRICKVTI